jgi:hypothetical protein
MAHPNPPSKLDERIKNLTRIFFLVLYISFKTAWPHMNWKSGEHAFKGKNG